MVGMVRAAVVNLHAGARLVGLSRKNRRKHARTKYDDQAT